MDGMIEKHFAALIAHRGTVAKLSTMAVLAVISVAWPAAANSQAAKPVDTLKPQAKPVAAGSQAVKPTLMTKQMAAGREAWRQKIIHTPRPKANACYRATYPDAAWHEVPCKAIPQKASLPRVARGVRADQVGGSGQDFSATTTNGITEAEGWFDSVTTSGTNNPTSFELQLNTAPFSTTTCTGSTATGVPSVPGCQGWEQFIYSTDNGGEVYIQYWLEQWGPSGATCKAPVSASCDGAHVYTDGWCPFTLNDGTGNFTDCAINSLTNSGIGTVAVASFQNNLALSSFPAGGSNALDDAIATVSGSANREPGVNEFPDLATNWTEAEFNIFGDGGNAQAVFDPNTTLEVRTSVASNTTLGPGCAFQSFTGESNNLTLVSTTSNPPKGNLPSLVFTETNVGTPTTVPCSSAISLGDTHIHPFNGNTEYDFQAYGDFLLAEAGPDFMVHTRQVPGPPGYPGTATNTAVAVMMGRTRVAVYLQPARLVIDGKTTDLAEGKSIVLPSGVQVTHTGTEYSIFDESGNTVIANLVSNGAEALWMDVRVNLGRSPDSRVRGLLGNPSDRIDEIQTSTGVMLKVPVDVNDLYGRYADSWRVDPAKSLFVELPPAQIGVPKVPLTAADLTPAVKAHAITVCKAAGITNAALLNDCILDTTVLKNDLAVKIFTKVAPPKLVIKPVMRVVPK